MTKTYYITTPIYYVNDVPHIGHAYTTLACDVMARFKRLDGYDVRFLTGTDEHGQKVQQAAQAEGLEPQEFTDRLSQNFRDLTKTMKFSNDDFIRTTEERHKNAAKSIWQALIDSGDIYLDVYEGWYSVRDEEFYAEKELNIVDGEKVAPTGAPVKWVEEPSYFFRLSAWQDRLLEHYENNPNFILPKTRRNEMISFVKTGLRDISVSRSSFDWGIPVPNDDDHIMYVWLDALTNYLTAVDYPDTASEAFKKYWPADLHMIGKDILRFHTVYWPAFLMAAGIELPKRVFAHGWWTNNKKKISKSLGNVIDPNELIEQYGLDPVRYFLLREVPFGNDGDFSHKVIVGRLNNDLANDLGNLCQRVLSLIAKNCDGKLPEPVCIITNDDVNLLLKIKALLGVVDNHLSVQAYHLALTAIWEVIGDANRYVDTQAPWTLSKTDYLRMRVVLFNLIAVIRNIGIILQPFMPDSASKILDQLAIPVDERNFVNLNDGLAWGTKLPKPEPVFPRFVVKD